MDWKSIVWIISSVVILTITGAITRHFNNKQKKTRANHNLVPEHFTILKPTKMHFYIGIIGFIMTILLIIVGWHLDTSTVLSTKLILLFTLFIPMLLIPLYLLIYYLNYKITLYEDKFIYQNFWRCKKTIYYKDIKIDNLKMYTTIKIKNKKGNFRNLFKLTPYLDNSDNFMIYYKAAKSKKFKFD